MHKSFTLVILIFLSAPLAAQVKAQQSSDADSASWQLASDRTIGFYHDALGKNGHVFNGSEYVDYESRKEGHQYFLTDQWTPGSINYEGMLYSNVPVLYNLVSDDVIIGQVNETGLINKIKIDKNRVSEFDLDGRRFIHLKDADNTGLEAGFYQLLYNGTSQVLAKRKKTYKKEVVIITFPEENIFYLLKDGQYHVVKSKRSVLKVLKNHKKELTAFLKANNIIYSLDREYTIGKLAEQYDLLNNTL